MQPAQPKNPLHSVTLEKILTQLVEFYGWEYMGAEIPIRCFSFDPSIPSSLKFLRRTPWARTRVEELYLRMIKRQGLHDYQAPQEPQGSSPKAE